MAKKQPTILAEYRQYWTVNGETRAGHWHIVKRVTNSTLVVPGDVLDKARVDELIEVLCFDVTITEPRK